MNISDRIKHIRKSKGLTQEEFGNAIKISASAVSQLEKGKINPTDQTIELIVQKFQVSDEWLRGGAGEMFTPQDPEQEIATFLGKIVKDDDDSLRKRLISALAKLDESDWAALAEMVRKMKKDPEP